MFKKDPVVNEIIKLMEEQPEKWRFYIYMGTKVHILEYEGLIKIRNFEIESNGRIHSPAHKLSLYSQYRLRKAYKKCKEAYMIRSIQENIKRDNINE